eukprot:5625788-Prymnesium_polylepis.1
MAAAVATAAVDLVMAAAAAAAMAAVAPPETRRAPLVKVAAIPGGGGGGGDGDGGGGDGAGGGGEGLGCRGGGFAGGGGAGGTAACSGRRPVSVSVTGPTSVVIAIETSEQSLDQVAGPVYEPSRRVPPPRTMVAVPFEVEIVPLGLPSPKSRDSALPAIVAVPGNGPTALVAVTG